MSGGTATTDPGRPIPRRRPARWKPRVARCALGLVLGIAAFLFIAYDHTPGPHRVEVRTLLDDRPVSVTIDRYGGDRVGAGDLRQRAYGWEEVEPGRFSAEGTRWPLVFEGRTGPFVEVTAESEAIGEPVVEVLVDGGPPRTVAVDASGRGRALVELAPERSPMLIPLLALSIAGGTWLAGGLLRSILRLRSASRPVRAVAAGVATVAGIALPFAIPVPSPPVVAFDVEVSPTPIAAPVTGGTETWVRIQDGQGNHLPASDLRSAGSWEARDGWRIASAGTDPLRWRGLVPAGAQLELLAYPYAGTARVVVNGRERLVDASAGAAEVLALGLADLGGVSMGGRLRDLAARATAALALGAVAAAAFAVAIVPQRRAPHPASSVGARTSAYAIPLGLWWLAALLIFWPAVMSPDALDQLEQVRQGDLHDWHPYPSTLLIAGLARAAGSVAGVAVAQIALTALLLGRLLAWIDVRGGVIQARIGAVALALSPAVAMLTITVWKDTWFHLGVLGLALCAWRIADTRGRWLHRRRNVALVILAALTVLLLRHNGWPVVVATAALAAVAYRADRALLRNLAVAAGSCVVILLAVRGPIAAFLDVGPNASESIVYAFHIGAHVADGAELSDEEQELIDSLALVTPEGYVCWNPQSVVTLTAGRDEADRAAAAAAELRRLALRLDLEDPRTTLDHIGCASAILWRITDPPGASTYLTDWYRRGGEISYIPATPAEVAPLERTPSPRATRLVYAAAEHLPDLHARPALYLYALLAAAGVAGVRRRSWQPLAFVVPVAIQVSVLLPVNLSAHTRVATSTIVLALALTPALLTVGRRSHRDEDPRLRW